MIPVRYKVENGAILAAGAGTRLRDRYSGILPKPLIPVCSKPIIDYAIENLLKVGTKNIYVVVNFKKELIKEYLMGNYPGYNIFFVDQEKLTGIADAVYSLKDYIDSNAFAVQLADEIDILDNMEKLIGLFFEKGSVASEAAIGEKDSEVIKRTCEIKIGADNRIIQIREKPLKPKYEVRGLGFYMFRPEIFKFIENTEISKTRNEREITDTISLVSEDGRAHALEMSGASFNINTSRDLIEARRYLSNCGYEKSI